MENESNDFTYIPGLSNSGTITITNNGTTTTTWYPGSGTTYIPGTNTTWHYVPPAEIQIGRCTLKEVDGELHWVYPDGTSTVLTGKGKNFNDLYNIMNGPEERG